MSSNMNYNVENNGQIYICPYCMNTFKTKSLFWFDKYIGYEDDKIKITGVNSPELHVKCKKCNDYMFLCDNFIASQIINLNLIGLKTQFCCEGHIEVDNEGKFVGCSTPYVIIEMESEKDAKNIYSIIRNHKNRFRFKNMISVELIDGEDIKWNRFTRRISVKYPKTRISIRLENDNMYNKDGYVKENFKEIFEKEKYIFKIFLHNIYSMKKINL